MANAQQTFNLLQRELPDPDTTLFEQITRQFTLFPQLPPELRLQIWRATFPASRYVNLAGPCLDMDGFPHDGDPPSISPSEVWEVKKSFHQDRNELRSEFPVALSVNSESRAESRKHYAVTSLKPDAGMDLYPCVHEFCRPVPLWVNPQVDSVFIDSWAKESLDKLIPYLSRTCRQLLPKIKKLDIYIHCSKDHKRSVFDEFDFFLKFPSLHTIRFETVADGDSSDEEVPREALDKFRREFKSWFRTQTKRQQKVSIQHIYFEEWWAGADCISLFERKG